MDRIRFALFFAVACGGEDAGSTDPCAGVECSGHGVCHAEGPSASCFCDPGWVPQGLTCEPGGGDSDVDGDSDADSDGDSDTTTGSETDTGTDTSEPCGNGDVDAGEDCDDGNRVDDGNGCTADCRLNGACGDGIRQDYSFIGGSIRSEDCDDAGIGAGDGCDTNCLAEIGWDCDRISNECLPHCGDGRRVGVELEGKGCADGGCDDGNEADGDGCNSRCREEEGYECIGAGGGTCNVC